MAILPGFIFLLPHHLLWPLPIQLWVSSSSMLFPPNTPCLLLNLAVSSKAEEQHVFSDQRHAMHPFQHLLHLLMAIQARLACSDQSDTKAYVLGGKHCPQGCSAGCRKTCSARFWLPSALVSGVLHYILHRNPDSKEERSMAMYPAW